MKDLKVYLGDNDYSSGELQDIIAREMSLFNRDSAVRVLKQAYDRAVAAEQADV